VCRKCVARLSRSPGLMSRLSQLLKTILGHVLRRFTDH
jgi:hypothetical protein